MILDGKTVVVTGVGPGLGGEVAKLVLRDGGNVVLAARTADKLEGIAQEVDPTGARVAHQPTDIGDAERAPSPSWRSTASVPSTVSSGRGVRRVAGRSDED
jgi:NAD(P)-dependent dehydrogenase (short-subunit alcohol dehydrogenase family)